VIRSAAANNWLFVIAVPRAGLPTSDRPGGRQVNRPPQPVDLWTAAEGGRCCPRAAAHKSTGSTTAPSILMNEIHPLRIQKRPKVLPKCMKVDFAAVDAGTLFARSVKTPRLDQHLPAVPVACLFAASNSSHQSDAVPMKLPNLASATTARRCLVERSGTSWAIIALAHPCGICIENRN
jgi:hypothetical protein